MTPHTTALQHDAAVSAAVLALHAARCPDSADPAHECDGRTRASIAAVWRWLDARMAECYPDHRALSVFGVMVWHQRTPRPSAGPLAAMWLATVSFAGLAASTAHMLTWVPWAILGALVLLTVIHTVDYGIAWHAYRTARRLRPYP